MVSRRPPKLRPGFTTGTAAAAAAKAATLLLFGMAQPRRVSIDLLNGQSLNIALDSVAMTTDGAVATVIKDAGDDPDITHKARIGARVRLVDEPGAVIISGGPGVGRVTKPGLEIPPGEPAINLGPRKMICQAIDQVRQTVCRRDGIHVTVFVQDGEILAQKTLNARLGIEGGLSILGTTGLVKPLSHQAYTATIAAALSVARACGADQVVLTTGRRSERFAQARFTELPEEAFIQIGDYFQMAMQHVADLGFPHVVLAVFFGKALKMAQGFPHTHAAQSELTLHWLADVARKITGDHALADEIGAANTARQAFGLIYPTWPQLLAKVSEEMIRSAMEFSHATARVRTLIFDFDGEVASDSHVSGNW